MRMRNCVNVSLILEVDNDKTVDKWTQEITNSMASKERRHVGFEGIRKKKPTLDSETIQLATAENSEIRPRLDTAERVRTYSKVMHVAINMQIS